MSCARNPEFSCEEIKIPLPSGGHIAAKWWGSKSIRPFVCVHGLLNNAGSFDRLIPMLPRECSYLAIDLPSHGRSSWYPSGIALYNIGFLQIFSIIMSEYKWKKISLIGHSMGGGLSFIFASVFPERVDVLITIEALKPLFKSAEQVIKSLRNAVDKGLIANERNRSDEEPPSYSIEEATERMVKGSYGSVTKETAKYLLERSIEPSVKHPGKFFFSIDNRLKYNMHPGMAQEVSLDLARYIKIPCLTIMASAWFDFEPKRCHEEALEVMRESPYFEYFVADSTSHHIHLTEPEKIANKLCDFIRKCRSRDIERGHL